MEDNIERHLENGLADGIAERINKATQQLKQPPETPVPRRTTLETFLVSTANMLATQRAKILDAESDYQLERVKLANNYRTRMENLKAEWEDAVRELDQRYRRDSADANELLARLTAMRAID